MQGTEHPGPLAVSPLIVFLHSDVICTPLLLLSWLSCTKHCQALLSDHRAALTGVMTIFCQRAPTEHGADQFMYRGIVDRVERV